MSSYLITYSHAYSFLPLSAIESGWICDGLKTSLENPVKYLRHQTRPDSYFNQTGVVVVVVVVVVLCGIEGSGQIPRSLCLA